jgi:hypothetical protein
MIDIAGHPHFAACRLPLVGQHLYQLALATRKRSVALRALPL